MTVRRILDTVSRSDGSQLEELAGRALASPPPYRPVPSGPLCHIQIEDGVVMAAEHDLDGSLLDLATAVLAEGGVVCEQRARLRGGRGTRA
jgi:hypothetical protein